MERPSLATIAERAHCSPATVSLVLNGRARSYRIAEHTCERVTRVAADLGYTPNEQARRLKGLGTTTIGLVVPELDNQVFASAAAQAEALALERGWHLWIVDTRGDADRQRRQIASLRSRGIDALVVANADPDFRVDDLPAVLIDRHADDHPVAVVSDNAAATARLCGELFEHGVFGPGTWFVGGDPQITTAVERRVGFDRAARAAGIDPRSLPHRERGFAPVCGARAMREALAADAPAVFAASLMG